MSTVGAPNDRHDDPTKQQKADDAVTKLYAIGHKATKVMCGKRRRETQRLYGINTDEAKEAAYNRIRRNPAGTPIPSEAME